MLILKACLEQKVFCEGVPHHQAVSPEHSIRISERYKGERTFLFFVAPTLNFEKKLGKVNRLSDGARVTENHRVFPWVIYGGERCPGGARGRVLPVTGCSAHGECVLWVGLGPRALGLRGIASPFLLPDDKLIVRR